MVMETEIFISYDEVKKLIIENIEKNHGLKVEYILEKYNAYTSTINGFKIGIPKFVTALAPKVVNISNKEMI